MSDATSSQDQPEQDGVESALIRRYEAQTEASMAQTAFWRRVAKWAIGALVVVGLALVALAVVLVLIASSTHREGVESRQKAEQVLAIAREFECEQTPPPIGCPPRPPVSSGTQAIIDQVVNATVARIEQIYPPPRAP